MVVEGYNAMSGYGPWKCPRTTTAAKFSIRPPTAAVFPQDSSTHLHCTHENSSDLGHFILASREPGSQFVHQLATHDPSWNHCGNDYGNAGGKDVETACSSPCSGNQSIMCGAGWHNSIFAIS